MVIRLMPVTVKIQATGLSDVGLVRENNEDVWMALPDLHFYVLADGMGGHQAGEVAAREAVATLCRLIKKNLGSSKKNKNLKESCIALEHAIEAVNTLVYRMGKQDPELKGMGTTLCCLQIHSEGVIIAHVGDSRIYRSREGQIELMTKDHSLLRELVDLGQISEQNVPEFLYKNILTQAIGTEPSVAPTVLGTELKAGDIYLLCTDGLSDMISKKEMEAILKNYSTVDESAKALVDMAKEHGGLDNVTVVLVKIEEINEAADIL